MRELKTIYLDFDGTIVNTIKAIVSLYNKDFLAYKNFEAIRWWEVNTWNFEECKCASADYLNTYFNQPRFFAKLEFMPEAKDTIKKLSEKYDVKVVSMGYSPNLKLKGNWILYNLPMAEFLPINMKEHDDKSHIDMRDGILIDDSSRNLLTSNATEKFLYGNDYQWNKGWNGNRFINWEEIRKYLL